MNSIRILCTKCCKYNSAKLVSYTDNLTREAKLFPGFIKSKKYWVPGTTKKIITISDWDDITNWNQWFYSEKRADIVDFFNQDIISDSHIVLIKNNHT